MQISSSKKKTRHILVRVTPYSPYETMDEFMEFGFLYFEYSNRVEDEVKLFHKNWKTRKLRISRFPVDVSNAILLPSYSIENADNMMSPDYKHIKFDSFNHLKHEPIFNEYDKFYRIKATLLCHYDYFEIDVERIPDGDKLPWIIYRARANYIKLINYSELNVCYK